MRQYGPGSDGLLEPLLPWLNDAEVSEILINQPGEVWIEKCGKMQSNSVPELHESHLLRLFQLIANENSQCLSKQRPLLSGSLVDGSRVQLCLPPTAQKPTLSIRRKVVRNLTLQDYEKQNFYKHALSAELNTSTLATLSADDRLLWELYQQQRWGEFVNCAINARKTIIISGGTSSGKTTYLNACLHHIDASERLLILEDTREIETSHPNQVQLIASKGDQGEACISMQDLVQCCLRLRPDRIIMGEIRGKEIMDFVSACSTGHDGSMTTIHANNPKIAFMRMTQMYKLNNVPSMSDADIMRELKEVIDIIIQLEKAETGRVVTGVYYKYADVESYQRD